MSRTVPDKWIHRRDFDKVDFGREDPPELSESCWTYLIGITGEHPATEGPRSRSPNKAAEASANVIAATVQKHALITGASDELRRAMETIDRLLAFAPARFRELPPETLAEIKLSVVRETARAFPNAQRMECILSTEEDVDSSAPHRLTVRVTLPAESDPEATAEGIVRVHDVFAQSVGTAYAGRIRLIVEPITEDEE